MRKILIVLICIGILVSWQIYQSDLANAGGKGHKCSLAGTWIGEVEGGGYDPVILTNVPLDPTGKRFATISETPEPRRPNWLTQDPPSVRDTSLNGPIVRVGKNLFKSSAYSFGVYEGGEIAWEIEASMMLKFLDCDHTVTVMSNTVFGPDREFLFCFTSILRSTRLEMFEPCEDLPEFPE